MIILPQGLGKEMKKQKESLTQNGRLHGVGRHVSLAVNVRTEHNIAYSTCSLYNVYWLPANLAQLRKEVTL